MPIPYGFGGVVPGAMGGNPNLGGINNNILSLFGGPLQGQIPGGMPGGNLQSLVGQLNLSPTGAYSPFPRVASGWQGFGGAIDVPSYPVSGPSSAFPRAAGMGMSEVPVSIRGAGRGAAMTLADDAALALGGAEGAGAAGAAKGVLGRISSRLPMAEGVGLKGFAKGAVGPLIASIALNKAGSMAGGDESFLGRALKGAGTGSIGFALGPEVGIPTTILAAAFNAFKGKPKDGTPIWLDDDVLNRAGFDDTDKAQIKMTYDILKETQGKDKANAAIGQIIMSDMTNRQQQRQQDESSQRRMLATQALTAQFFQPFTKQMMDSAQQRYAISESVAKDLPPEYRSLMRAQNVAALDNAQRTATAYASQAQLIPQMAGMDYQMNLANQLSQQQAAGVIQQMGLGAGVGGGGGSLSGLAGLVSLDPNAQAGG